MERVLVLTVPNRAPECDDVAPESLGVQPDFFAVAREKYALAKFVAKDVEKLAQTMTSFIAAHLRPEHREDGVASARARKSQRKVRKQGETQVSGKNPPILPIVRTDQSDLTEKIEPYQI
jgi:hypothetical protein